MDRKHIAWIILVSVIVLVIVSFALPIWVRAPQPVAGLNPPPPQQGDPSQKARQSPNPTTIAGPDKNEQLKTAISFINIGLIIPLFVIYTGIYRRMHSTFTLGLLAVIFALGMYAVTSNPLIVSLLGGNPGEIGIFQIVPDLCATAALVALVKVSME